MAVSEDVEDEVEALLNNNENNNNDLIKCLKGVDRFEKAVEIARSESLSPCGIPIPPFRCCASLE